MSEGGRERREGRGEEGEREWCEASGRIKIVGWGKGEGEGEEEEEEEGEERGEEGRVMWSCRCFLL